MKSITFLKILDRDLLKKFNEDFLKRSNKYMLAKSNIVTFDIQVLSASDLEDL